MSQETVYHFTLQFQLILHFFNKVHNYKLKEYFKPSLLENLEKICFSLTGVVEESQLQS